MKRRSVLAFLGAFLLGGGTALRRAFAAPGQPAPERTMAAVADTMFPGGDGLPAASALGLHGRVLAMPELQTSIGKGVAWLDRHAASRGVADFSALDEAGRLAALDAAFASTDEGIRPFVFALRSSLAWSIIPIQRSRRLSPIPARRSLMASPISRSGRLERRSQLGRGGRRRRAQAEPPRPMACAAADYPCCCSMPARVSTRRPIIR